MSTTGADGWNANLAEKRVKTALILASVEHPYLSGLAHSVDIRFEDCVETAGVTASGRIFLAPAFFDTLTVRDVAIILAHELLHLFRGVHARSENAPDPWLINIADDFIVNDIISRSLDCDRNTTVLRNGLIWERFLRNFKDAIKQPMRPAYTYSLEEMVVLLRRVPGLREMPAWKPRKTGEKAIPEGWLEKALRKSMPPPPPAKPKSFPPEIITSGIERKLFPEERPEAIARRAAEFAERARRSVGESAALAMVDAIVEQRGNGDSETFRRTSPGADKILSGRFEMLRDMYRTPWESALQRWFDSAMPGERSWARPSRRGAWRTDVVLPGRTRRGWLLHVVLDVNDAMADSLPSALGALAGFCEANHVETIHLVQVRNCVVGDEHLTPEDLELLELRLPNPGVETPLRASTNDDGSMSTAPVHIGIQESMSGGWLAPLRSNRSIAPKIMGDRHPKRGVRKRPFRVKRPKETTKPLPLPDMMPALSVNDNPIQPSSRGIIDMGLAEAFLLLEEKYEAESAVVVTGGGLPFPPMPSFDVLWALVGAMDARCFAAPYGTAVHIYPT